MHRLIGGLSVGLLVLGLLILTIPGSAQDNIPTTENELYNYAEQNLGENKYTRASQAYERFINNFPDSQHIDNAYYHLAFCYQELRKHKESQQTWQTLIERLLKQAEPNIDPGECQFRLARSFEQSGDKESAIREYKKILKTPAFSSRAHNVIWRLWELLGKRLDLHVNKTFVPGEDVTISAYGHNINKVTFRAYSVNLSNVLARIEKQDKQLDYYARNIMNFTKPEDFTLVEEWPEELNLPKNSWQEKPIKIPVKDTGLYVVECLLEEDFTLKLNLLVTQLGLISKSARNKAVIFAVDRKSGEPLRNIPLKILPYDTQKEIISGTTNEDGLFITDQLKDINNAMAIAHHEQGFAFTRLYNRHQSSQPKHYTYTDRPIYRPNQTIYFKTIFRNEGQNSQFTIPDNQDVQVEIRDPKGNIVYKKTLKANEFGTLTGQMKLTDEPPLGHYYIRTNLGGHAQFRVEEYRKPEYKVNIKSQGGPFINGDTITACIKADYYFGSPVQQAEVTYTIHQRQLYQPYYWRYDPYNWYYEEEDSYRHGYGYGQQVHQGAGQTDKNGALTISYQTKKQDYNCLYTIVAQVTDKSRRQVTGSTSLKVTQAEFSLSLRTSKYVYKSDETIDIQIKTLDIDQSPVEDVSLTLEIIKTDVSPNRPLLNEPLGTNAQGIATYKFTPSTEGYLKLIARAKDRQGNPVKTEHHVWVASRNYYSSFTNFTGLSIVLDKKSYAPGETVQAMIISQHKDAHILLTYERDGIEHAEMLHLKGNSKLLEIPVQERHKPNFFVNILSVKDNQILRSQAVIIVPPKDKFITVKITPDKNEYRPRETAQYLVQTFDADGKPVQAEFSLGLVDESIYALQKEFTQDIRKFYHGRKHNQVATADSFHYWSSGQAGNEMKSMAQQPDASMESLDEAAPRAAKPMMKEAKGKGGDYATTEIRAYFPDTMFWQAQGMTDEKGEARFEILVPDSLTTWRATVRAITADTRVGEATHQVIARKNIIVRLETPRFFTQKDQLTISAIVHNYLPREKEVKVVMEVDNLKILTGSKTSQVSIKPSEETLLNWQVSVDEVGSSRITVKALTDEESDAMQLVIPIIPHGTQKYQARAGMVDEEISEFIEIPPDAIRKATNLRIGLSPSMASTVIDALDYLAGYPYGCVEQTMSRFLPTVVTVRCLDNLGMAYDSAKLHNELPQMVSAGLQRLYGFQHSDGGWGWWEHDKTHPLMTAYVIYGLAQAGQAGFEIDNNVLSRGINSLKDQLKKQANLDTQAYMLYSLSFANQTDQKVLNHLYNSRSELNNYTQSLLAWVLFDADETERQRGPAPSGKEKAEVVIANLIDNAQTSPTSCWWESKVKKYGSWTGDNIEATAYILKSILKVSPQEENIHKIVRWLANKRQGNRWVSTKQTAAVVFALCDYLVVSKELEADYTLEIFLNGEPITQAKINHDNLLTFDGRLLFPWHKLSDKSNEIKITKQGQGNLYYSVYLSYYSQAEDIKASEGGITIKRAYQIMGPDNKWVPLEHQPVKSGDEIEVTLTVTADSAYEYIMMEDPLPAGCEVIKAENDYRSQYRWDWRWNYWYSRREFRDEKVCVGITQLPQGKQTITYRLRAETPGDYHVLPARAFNMYAPEIGGNSAENRLVIEE